MGGENVAAPPSPAGGVGEIVGGENVGTTVRESGPASIVLTGVGMSVRRGEEGKGGVEVTGNIGGRGEVEVKVCWDSEVAGTSRVTVESNGSPPPEPTDVSAQTAAALADVARIISSKPPQQH